jgi:hypothetical protein
LYAEKEAPFSASKLTFPAFLVVWVEKMHYRLKALTVWKKFK